MQVVTSENFQQLVETGKVEEFKAPEAAVAKAAEAAVVVDKPRGEDGKFIAKDAEVKADEVDEAAKAAVESDDPDDADLPERVRKQIGKKHREMREAQEYARELRADREAVRERAERAEAALKAIQDAKSGPASVEDAKAPKAEDFKTVGEYAEALAEYKVEKKFAEREAKQERQRREQAAVDASNALDQRIEATIKEIPDYLEVIGDCKLDAPPHMTVYMAESPLGPKIGYHFAKTDAGRADFDRIAKLSPIRAIAELGKLEDRLDKKPDVKADKADAGSVAVSRAPAPINPLDSAAKTVVQKDPSKMNIQELREYDRQQRVAKSR